MALVETSGLVHFSIPVNNLEESITFYTEVLGMKARGKVGPTGFCVMVGETPIVLVGRTEARDVAEPRAMNGQLCHQAFSVSSEDYDRAQASFRAHGVHLAEEEWRKTGTFTGRSQYFEDPSGNILEINDANPPFWPEGLTR